MANLTEEAFGSTLWNLTNELTHVDASAFSSIRNAALMLGFLVVAFQIFIIMWQSHKDDSNAASRMVPRLIALFLQVGLVSALLLTDGYNVLYKYVIGVPAETIAETITVAYIDDYQAQTAEIFLEEKNAAEKVWTIVTATLNGSLVSTIIATVFFVINSIIVYLFPLLQGKFYLYLYYVGPLALIFTFCDYTQGVTRSWLNLALAVAWTSVFGSIALLLSVNAGVFVDIKNGLASGDWIQTTVYCAASILLLVSAFPIAQYFFGAMGSGVSNNPASLIGQAAGATAGAVVAGAATTAVAGKIMSAVGQKLGGGTDSGIGGSSQGGGSDSAHSSSTQSNQSNVSESTVPSSGSNSKSFVSRVGNAMSKSGEFLNKAGKAALAVNVDSRMPQASVGNIEKLLDPPKTKATTPGRDGRENV